MSREITKSEARELFLQHLVNIKNFWLQEDRAPTPEAKLDGLLYSFLVTLDGNSGGSPGFLLIPKRKGNPDITPGYNLVPLGTEVDKQDAISEGEQYYQVYPENIEEKYDIGGNLRYELNSHLKSQPECLFDFNALVATSTTKKPEACRCPMVRGGGINHKPGCSKT